MVYFLLKGSRFVDSEWSNNHTFVPGVRREGFSFIFRDNVNFKRFIVLLVRLGESSITSMPRLPVISFIASSGVSLRLDPPIKSGNGLLGPDMFGLGFRFPKIGWFLLVVEGWLMTKTRPFVEVAVLFVVEFDLFVLEVVCWSCSPYYLHVFVYPVGGAGGIVGGRKGIWTNPSILLWRVHRCKSKSRFFFVDLWAFYI